MSLSHILIRENAFAYTLYSDTDIFLCAEEYLGGPKWTRTTDLTLIRRAL